MLGWYDAIVGSVTEITAGTRADRGRRARLRGAARRRWRPRSERAPAVLAARRRGGRRGRPRPRRGDVERRRDAVRRHRDDRGDDRQRDRAPAARIPEALAAVRAEPALLANAIEESLRLEPAAAVIDRYSTRATTLGGRGDRRARARRRLDRGRQPRPGRVPRPGPLRRPAREREAARRVRGRAARLHRDAPRAARGAGGGRAGRSTRLPGLELAGDPAARGLVFRKPDALRVRWTPAPSARLRGVLILGIVLIAVGVVELVVVTVDRAPPDGRRRARRRGAARRPR